jgi:hypothetical protein
MMCVKIIHDYQIKKNLNLNLRNITTMEKLENMIYPYSNMFFKVISFIFRRIPKKYKLQFMGILLQKNLHSPLLPVKAEGYELKEAEEKDIRYLGNHEETLDYDIYKYRHLKGHLCFCAKKNNEVICYVWISPKVCGLFFGTEKEIEILPLKSNQVFSYDLYTYKKYRHKGIASQVQNFTNKSLTQKGVTERLSIISPSNISSMKIQLRAGFEPLRMIYLFGIKKYKKVFLGTTKKSNKLEQWKKAFENAYHINK